MCYQKGALTIPQRSIFRAYCPAGIVLFVFFALFQPQEAAGATFTPSINAQLGYTDNVRFQDPPCGDAYVTVSPGFKLETGRPSRRLLAQGKLDYSEYYRLSEYSRIEGGFFNLGYLHQFSPKTQIQLRNDFSSTYDAPVEDLVATYGAPQGLPDEITLPTKDTPRELERIRTKGGRRDQNTTSVQGQHRFGRQDLIFAGYSYTRTRNTDDDAEGSDTHRVKGGLTKRLGPLWRAEMNGSGETTDYERSATVDRYRATASLVRMLGPKKEAMVSLGYDDVRSNDTDPDKRQARSYKIYSASLGYTHHVSPTLSWGASGGWSSVDGEKQGNLAAGDNYPTFYGWLTYKARRWSGYFYAQHSLGEYDVYGDNSGLTLTSRIGGRLTYQLARHWTLNLNAAYVRNNYKQDPTLAGTDQSGDVDSILAGLSLSWHMARHVWLSLDYRFIDNDGEYDIDDRRQNKVVLMLSVDHPYRW